MMDLHGKIMNIRASSDINVCGEDLERTAYLVGHRDARHEAAEMAVAADQEIAALRAQLATARAKAEALDHIAEMVSEKDDPFAAWEVVDHFKRQAEKDATARADALRAAGEICQAFALEITNSVPAQEYTDVDTCIVLRHRILALIDKEPSNGS